MHFASRALPGLRCSPAACPGPPRDRPPQGMAGQAQYCYDDPLWARQSICPDHGRPRGQQLVTLLCAGGAVQGLWVGFGGQPLEAVQGLGGCRSLSLVLPLLSPSLGCRLPVAHSLPLPPRAIGEASEPPNALPAKLAGTGRLATSTTSRKGMG
eukprot:1194110-Pyramimonas_sp.AAC.1